MKKFLLLMIGFVCVLIGAWAQPGGQDGYEIQHGTWHSTEKVAVIHLTQPGALTAALEALEVKANETDPNTGELTKPAQDLNGYTMIKIDSKQAGPQGAVVDIELTADDIAALSSISTAVTTIDLQDLKNVDGNGDVSAFTFTHSNVRNLILPDNWTKEEVNTCAMGIAQVNNNLGSCISQGTFPSTTIKNKTYNGTILTAYINTGNTLYDVIDHAYYDGNDHKNMKLSSDGHYGSNYSLSSVNAVVISGNPVARDLCNSAGNVKQKFVEGGHFEFNEALLETEDQVRTLKGEEAPGALSQITNLISLDLSEAHVSEVNIEDLTLKNMDIISGRTIEVKIPKYIETIPADFLNTDHDIRELCIPGNIKYIKTRAFAVGHIDHIWTTSNVEGDNGRTDLAYDNGIMTNDGLLTISTDPSAPLPYESYDQYLWGTYTLPSNLQLIERFAFGTHGKHDARVKDLYVLNIHAPECHVDAFPSLMCAGNLAYDQAAIDAQGIITRDAYTNNSQLYTWVTMLHYPRESTTPDIQRYQDVTRKYSIATTDVDGKGATIYYPNLSEMARSYMQGTYGYLWDAWDPERNLDGSNSFMYSDLDKNAMPYTMYDEEGQQKATEEYLNNNSDKVNKAYTSFYDVTSNGTYTQPDGLVSYDLVKWNNVELNTENGTLLYPAAQLSDPYYKYDIVVDPANYDGVLYVCENGEYVEYTGGIEEGVTYYSRVQIQDRNSDGSLKYEECTNGSFVAYTDYVENDEGLFVKDLTVENVTDETTENTFIKEYSWIPTENGNGEYVRKFTQDHNGTDYMVYEYTEAINGDFAIFVDYKDQQNINHIRIIPWEDWIASQSNYTRCSRMLVGFEEYPSGGYGQIPQGVYQIPNDLRGNLGNYENAEGYEGLGIFYNKVYTSPVNYVPFDPERDLSDEPRYFVTDNGYRTFNSETDADLQRYKDVTLYREITEGETGTHCPSMVDAIFRDVVKSNDYRGWHQFIIGSYSANTTEEMEPIRSYITDSDWWTICSQYDVRYSEMKVLFGNPKEGKIPYLSKLLYVVRDVENNQITLMFSKNLMVYKEQFKDENGQLTGYEQFPDAEGKFSGRVHGYIDESEDGKWSQEELTNDPVILHAGVPYMIKPEIPTDANRQFDVYRSQINEGLTDWRTAILSENFYDRLVEARSLSGPEHKELIYNGEYQVPAYVINNVEGNYHENTLGSGSLTITMKDGSTFTYPALNEFSFKGNTYQMEISSDFTYTFVGTYYLSLMPQYSYFLGWNSKLNNGKGGAAFWYNRVNDPANYTWNNETGIICPNWTLYKNGAGHEITPASGNGMPARWEANASISIKTSGADIYNDDFGQNGNGQPNQVRGFMPMEYGLGMHILIDGNEPEDVVSDGPGLPDAISNVNVDTTKAEWYNVSGQKMNRKPTQNGVYIVNGKKYVVR